ncbi:SHOCT domain-containing protein [Virgibacillus sp. C22-A2]|uniref:SHOCT domain-containing protein n=1 Tax=Virgibacillus tibetensis TaxID=3042313 RepID=A0ABU6KJ33_9BACI|nr:SHOCT domain-containing protein [Virgibacillus sp. C22-A2]
MNSMFAYGSIWPMICMLILWLGLMILGYFLIRNFIHGGNRSKRILRERFARGEIDNEEFERLKSHLKD